MFVKKLFLTVKMKGSISVNKRVQSKGCIRQIVFVNFAATDSQGGIRRNMLTLGVVGDCVILKNSALCTMMVSHFHGPESIQHI